MNRTKLVIPSPGMSENGPIISVDDDKLFHVLMRIAHKKCGCCNQLFIFDNGPKCIEYLRQAADGFVDHPSIILLDVNMPGMNGFETLKNIRQIPEYRDEPAICMLSATCEDTDINTAIALGADDFWEKPINLVSIPIFAQYAN